MSAVDELVAALSTRLSARVTLQDQIINGDEAEVWAATADSARYVVHILTSAENADHLSWCHDVAIEAAKRVPEVVPPVVVDGASFFRWNGQLVTVFPFVEGTTLDRNDLVQVRHAARLLAQIHRELLDWTGGQAPWRQNGAGDPSPALDDPDLDHRWESHLPRLRTGVCHGDYYRRNLLVMDRAVRGVIDWHEAHIGPLVAEVAWAAWELGHDDEMQLVRPRFDLFVDEYRRAADGQIPEWEYELVPTATRVMLRDDIRGALARGGSSNDEYQRHQVNAFWTLERELT